jgi:hypothetical protein
MANTQAPNPNSNMPKPVHAVATHLSSHHLTPTLICHRFRLDPAIPWRPTQHIELQFPHNLDPTGTVNPELDKRRLLFTPCNAAAGGPAATILLNEVKFIAGAGRIASLIGLPRFIPLAAEVMCVGGGFYGAFEDGKRPIAVAGGSGVAPFLAVAWGGTLMWSVRAIDAELLRVVDLGGWKEVKIFITGAEQHQGPALRSEVNGIANRHGSMEVLFRRMRFEDLTLRQAEDILFCGGKALEWQIKMWAMKTKSKVVTTTR